jgi:hypothetical protein
MLAKFRSSSSQHKSPQTEKKESPVANVSSKAAPRARLTKRKPVKSSDKVDSRPSSSSSLNSSPTPPAPQSPVNHSKSNFDFDFDFGGDPYSATRRPSDQLPDGITRNAVAPHSTVKPDRNALRSKSLDLGRTNLVSNILPRTGKPQTPNKAEQVEITRRQDGETPKELDETMRPKPNLHRASTEDHRRPTRKLIKKSTSDDPSKSPNSSPKRRFSYSASSPNISQELSKEGFQHVSITATRVPEFSSAYESKMPSDTIQVTIVDRLPHQKSNSPSHRKFPSVSKPANIPPTIEEDDVNEEFLLEQEEVLSYLQNTLLLPTTPLDSPRTLTSVSDGGLPPTPPVTNPVFRDSISTASSTFIDDMMAEFPYLFGDEKSILETQPLHPKDKSELYSLGPTPSGSSSSLPLPKIPTQFPPSPPQSEGRLSVDRALLEELASESESMKSVVDAINRASSSRSSFDTENSDEESLYDDDESSILPPEPQRPWTRDSDTRSDSDNESIRNFTAPILRTGRPSFQGTQSEKLMLTRSASEASKSTVFEDGDIPIAEVLAEKRRNKPQLAPLVITPIAPGQYGPPLQRRQHLRGRGKFSSPTSARGGFEGVKPTMIKVVDEEVVEYTPIEEGEKGWMRLRRVSRGGKWVTVEREVLKQGAI